jgi:hypothetical protein
VLDLLSTTQVVSMLHATDLGKSCLVYTNQPLLYFCCRGHDVVQILLALNGSSKYPRASSALSSILTRNALNPGDITVLYKLYSSQDPPPVELVRLSQFMGK